MIIDSLVAFSNKYGSDGELVLAGGGNTSAKEGNVLFIKGSGTSLSTITSDGFVRMDRRALAEMLEKSYPAADDEREAAALADLMAAKLPGEEQKRPSVETLLHAIFPQTFVLHLHPALVNALTCSKDGEAQAKALFGDGAVWVGLCRPGYILAKLCFEKMREYSASHTSPVSVLLLENHGIFIAADTVEELDRLLSHVMSSLGEKVAVKPDFTPVDAPSDAFLPAVKEAFGADSVVVSDTGADAVRFSSSRESAAPLLSPFTPDHIVYCKAFPLFVDSPEAVGTALGEYIASNGYSPKIVIAKDAGFFAVGKSEKDAATAALLFNDAIKIAVCSESFGGPLHMTKELTDFIVNWEVESYRSKQN